MSRCDISNCVDRLSSGFCRLGYEPDGRGCCDLMIQRTAPDELSPQMIIHDLIALKAHKLPAMQRSIDAAIEIIREAKDVHSK